MTRTRNIGKTIVIVLMTVLIAVGGFMTWTAYVWSNGPTDENMKGFAEMKGVNVETNYVMNTRKLLAHKLANEDPVRVIYVWRDANGVSHEDRTWYVYDDGAMKFEL